MRIVRQIGMQQKACGCVPWAFNLTLRQKVSKSLLSLLQNFKPSQDPIFCSPKAFSCYSEISKTDTYGCGVSCTGLYADVHFTEDKLLGKSLEQIVTELAAKG